MTASGFILSGGGVEITVGVSTSAVSSFVTVDESLNVAALLAADTDSDQQISIEVDIFREAALDSFVGFYAVDALTGAVLDSVGNAVTGAPTADDRAAYLQAAVDNLLFGEASPANNGVTTLNVTLDFSSLGTDIEILPFIIAGGDLDSVGGELENVYTTALGVNSDGADHVRRLGNSTYGFEDISGGGDNDFDDVVLTVNAVADV